MLFKSYTHLLRILETLTPFTTTMTRYESWEIYETENFGQGFCGDFIGTRHCQPKEPGFVPVQSLI